MRKAPRFLGSVAEWDRLSEFLLSRLPPAGWDTEFHGADLSRYSADTVPGRGLVHVWSIGLRTKRLNPRGYLEAESCVLPRDALAHPGLLAWLTHPGARKIGLNTPVDVHATENTWRLLGINAEVAGWEDILGRARHVYPERRAPGPGFGLDSLGKDLLGRGKIDSYEEVLSEPNVVSVERRKTTHATRCECGAIPCRARSSTPGHARHRVTNVDRWQEEVVRGTRLIPLETVLPGHERWERLVAYSGVDSELALEGDEVLAREEAELAREVPW